MYVYLQVLYIPIPFYCLYESGGLAIFKGYLFYNVPTHYK